MVKKAVLLIIVILVAGVAPVFALGGAEETSTQVVPYEGVEASSPFRGFLLGIASIFDRITVMASIGVSPFPSMISTDGETMPSSIYSLGGSSIYKERQISSTIGAIFISCLVAEILYIAIFKCFLLGDFAIAKQVASVFLKGMALFFVVINLPMLVELIRTGFQELAYTIAGAKLDDTSSLLTMRESVFTMPGSLIRSSIDIIELMNPENAGGTGLSVIDATADGVEIGFKTLASYMVKILYWIVQLICVVFLVVTAFHVMFNIIEVYLLIGIVSVLVPFQIFELTRFLGEKAIYSLFTNLVELFVIMVLMYSCQGVLAVTQDWVAETFINQASTETSVVFTLPDRNFISELEFTQISNLADEYGVTMPHNSYEEYKVMASGNYNWQGNTDLEGTLRSISVKMIEEAIRQRLIYASPGDTQLLLDGNYNGILYWDYSKVSEAASEGNLISKLSPTTQAAAMEYVMSQGGIFSTYGTGSREYDINTDIVPVHLASGLIVVFMTFYFVGQSTQITNALMSGAAATDGFAGATMKFAAGKAIGLTGRFAGGGIRTVGSGVKSLKEQKRASQHVTDNM